LKRKFSRARARISGRYAVVTALILALGIPSAAVGFGEGRSVLGGKRNPSRDATKAFSAETEIIANNPTYGTRQSNKRDGDGGGAIYGCRSNTGNEPCVKAVNLKTGHAFEFETSGKEGGKISVGDTTGAPFTTNATGVATGLNADKVDGKDGTDLATGALYFATVAADGTATGPRGAPKGSKSATGNTYTVTFDTDVSKCSYTTTSTGTDADAANSAPTTVVSSSGSDNKAVVVDEANLGPGTGFQLQVIC
jgi:hypothetical protein